MPDGSIARRPVITGVLLGLAGCFGESTVVVRPEPRVRFIEPTDGATVQSPVRVRFDVVGYEVRPAGDLSPGTGHHHLIINSEPIPAGAPIPFDNSHLHYGSGQVEATVELPPGTYTLTAQFADARHVAYGGLLTATIRVNVVSTPIG
jgi:hypothetical protein